MNTGTTTFRYILYCADCRTPISSRGGYDSTQHEEARRQAERSALFDSDGHPWHQMIGYWEHDRNETI